MGKRNYHNIQLRIIASPRNFNDNIVETNIPENSCTTWKNISAKLINIHKYLKENVTGLDNVCEYAIYEMKWKYNKKINSLSFWQYSSFEIFKPIKWCEDLQSIK